MEILTKTYGHGPQHIFCISGMFAGGWVWEPIVERLDLSELTVHVMQPALCELSSNFELLNKSIIEVIQNAVDSPVILAGNSLGGFLALMIAADKPELMSSVIISGAPGLNSIKMDIGQPTVHDADEWIHKLANTVCKDGSCVKKENFEKTIELWKSRKNLINLFRMAKLSNKLDALDYIDKLDCPVAGIWGDSDTLTPFAPWKEVLEARGYNCYTVSNSGHAPMYEAPVEFIEKMYACLPIYSPIAA